jgi:cytochrome c oxidase assembly protein subunit 15
VTATGPHGGDEDAERLTRWDITEVVRTHAVAAWVLLALTVVTLAWVHRGGAPREVGRRGAMLTAAILAQGAIGYVQYFSGVPPMVVLLHVAGSIVVWIAVLRFHLGLFVHPNEADERPTPDAREGRGESPTDGELATIEP